MAVQTKGSGEVIFSLGTSIASKWWLYFGPEILSSAVKGLPCLSAGEQDWGSQLHKSPRRTAFTPPEQASTADSALDTGQVPVPQGDLHYGHMNVGANLLSRQAVTHRKWKLHPEVVSQIWERFYETVVDLFAWQETAQCPPYFFLISSAPLGLHAMVHTWPRLHLYAFPSITLLPEVLAKVRQQGPLTNKCIVGWPECDSQI